MKQRIIIIILCFFSIAFYSTTSYAETQSTTIDQSTPQVITLTNTSPEYFQLDELKRIADIDNISFEQAVDDYFLELINEELSDNHKDNKELYSEELTVIPPNITIDGITLSEIEDLKVIAEMEGLDLDEAIERYAWQTKFIQVADELEEAYPDAFAGAVFEKDGSGAWFAFKHEIPQQVIKIAGELPSTIKFYGNRGFSEKELKATLDLVHYNIFMNKDIDDVYSHYDIETGSITVEAQPVEKLTTVKREMLKLQIQQIKLQNKSININIKLVDEIDGGEDRNNLRGGAYLFSCTTGFTLRNNVGSTGVATAHHCSGDSLTYENHFSGTSTLYRLYSHANSLSSTQVFILK